MIDEFLHCISFAQKDGLLPLIQYSNAERWLRIYHYKRAPYDTIHWRDCDLPGRIFKHKHHLYIKSFSDRYNLEKLVFYEVLGSIEEAIAYEKKLKKWGREKKFDLINAFNPEWRDLYDDVCGF